jgi:nucleotide-binding universal stress UspA family protein
MTTPNQAFRQAANSPAGREARDAAKSAADTARNIGDDVSDFASDAARKAGDFASDVSRRAGKEFVWARGVAADAWDELHDASERNPHVTLLVAFGLGLLFGIFAGSRR